MIHFVLRCLKALYLESLFVLDVICSSNIKLSFTANPYLNFVISGVVVLVFFSSAFNIITDLFSIFHVNIILYKGILDLDWSLHSSVMYF